MGVHPQKDKLSKGFCFISSTQEPPRRTYYDKSNFVGVSFWGTKHQLDTIIMFQGTKYQRQTTTTKTCTSQRIQGKHIEFRNKFELILRHYIM